MRERKRNRKKEELNYIREENSHVLRVKNSEERVKEEATVKEFIEFPFDNIYIASSKSTYGFIEIL